METVNVYSPVEDKKIRTEFLNSPIWKKASTEEEFMENPKAYQKWFKYTFKFRGTKVIQFNTVKPIVN